MKKGNRPLDPAELSYLIQPKIEGTPPLTHAFNASPENIERLERAVRANQRAHYKTGLSINPSETSELIR